MKVNVHALFLYASSFFVLRWKFPLRVTLDRGLCRREPALQAPDIADDLGHRLIMLR
jgi:hypothetical protein